MKFKRVKINEYYVQTRVVEEIVRWEFAFATSILFPFVIRVSYSIFRSQYLIIPIKDSAAPLGWSFQKRWTQFSPIVNVKDRQKWYFEGPEFAKILRSLEQFVRTVKGQDNLWWQNACSWTQRPRTNLSKRSLPKPKTITAWKLIPHRYDIIKN